MNSPAAADQSFRDDGVLTLYATDLNEVCVVWGSRRDALEPYAAFTPRGAREIARAILAMADALDEETTQ